MRIKLQLMLPNGARMLQIMDWVSVVNDGYRRNKDSVPSTISNVTTVMLNKKCLTPELKDRLNTYYEGTPDRLAWEKAKKVVKSSIYNNREYFDTRKVAHTPYNHLAYKEGWTKINKRVNRYTLTKRGANLLDHHIQKFDRRIHFMDAVDRYRAETKSTQIRLPEENERSMEEAFDYTVHTLPMEWIYNELGEEYKKYLKGYDEEQIDQGYLDEINRLLEGKLTIKEILNHRQNH